MKCHCGLHEHLKTGSKRLGLAGGVLFILHLLWHIAECLIIPALFTAVTHVVNAESLESPSVTIIQESSTTLLAPSPCLSLLISQNQDALFCYR